MGLFTPSKTKIRRTQLEHIHNSVWLPWLFPSDKIKPENWAYYDPWDYLYNKIIITNGYTDFTEDIKEVEDKIIPTYKEGIIAISKVNDYCLYANFDKKSEYVIVALADIKKDLKWTEADIQTLLNNQKAFFDRLSAKEYEEIINYNKLEIYSNMPQLYDRTGLISWLIPANFDEKITKQDTPIEKIQAKVDKFYIRTPKYGSDKEEPYDIAPPWTPYSYPSTIILTQDNFTSFIDNIAIPLLSGEMSLEEYKRHTPRFQEEHWYIPYEVAISGKDEGVFYVPKKEAKTIEEAIEYVKEHAGRYISPYTEIRILDDLNITATRIKSKEAIEKELHGQASDVNGLPDSFFDSRYFDPICGEDNGLKIHSREIEDKSEIKNEYEEQENEHEERE